HRTYTLSLHDALPISDNRLSNTNTNKRAFIDLNKYETFASSNSSLKKYLDINKFSIGLQYKLSGNKERAQTMFESLDTRSLNKKQLFLMRLNKPLLHLFVKIQNGLRSEEHTSELQSRENLVCRLLLEKK